MNTARVSRAMDKATALVGVTCILREVVGAFAADALREFFDECNLSEVDTHLSCEKAELDEFIRFLRAGAK